MGIQRAMAQMACAMALGLSPAFAFESVGQDEGMCTIDDPGPTGPAWQRPIVAVDPDCLVRASELKSTDARTIFVDVRPRSQIARAWVPGAAGIPPVLVGRDPLVKSSAFAGLMGNGKDTSRAALVPS